MGDFMKNALIKQESKAFIKGKRVKALSIILFLLIFCIVMTAVDFGIIFIADILRHLGVAATIALSAVLVLISFSVLLVYSSVSVGEKAWYGGITSNKRNFSKRFFFWLKPKNSLRAFRFKALLFLLKSMWAVVFFLPSAILAWSVYYLSGTGGLELYLFISLSGVNVLLVRESDGYILSSRNMLPGKVVSVKKGQIMASVAVELENGERLTSVCTVDSADDAGIAEGVHVLAAIKAPHVILAARQ